MEDVVTETTETTSTENFEPASFGEVLKGGKGKAASMKMEEAFADGEANEEATTPENPTENGAEKAVSETSEESAKEGETTSKEDVKTNGILKALQAERRKRQELEAELKTLRGETREPQTYYEDPEKFIEGQVRSVEKKYEDKIIAMSESMARQAHPDFDEQWKSFEEAAAHNPKLIDIAFNSENPGEEAYQLGKKFAFTKKYGTEPDEIRKNIEKEIYANVQKQVQADFEKKLSAKRNQPTSISSARAASGETEAYVSPTWGDALGKKRKR